jgi:hypothetical protein
LKRNKEHSRERKKNERRGSVDACVCVSGEREIERERERLLGQTNGLNVMG